MKILASLWNGQSKEPHNRLGFFEHTDWVFFDMRLGFLLTRAGRRSCPQTQARFFYFFIFYFRFLQKYIFVFKIYKNIPRPPRCRTTGTRSPRCGAAEAFLQKICEIFCRKTSGGSGGRPPRPPGSRAAGVYSCKF